MSNQCPHNTSITERPANGQRNYRISLCTWGCGEVLVSVERSDGLTDTWAVSELIEMAHRQRDEIRNMQLVILPDDVCQRLSQEPGTQAYVLPTMRYGWQDGHDVYVQGRYVGTINMETDDNGI